MTRATGSNTFCIMNHTYHTNTCVNLNKYIYLNTPTYLKRGFAKQTLRFYLPCTLLFLYYLSLVLSISFAIPVNSSDFSHTCVRAHTHVHIHKYIHTYMCRYTLCIHTIYTQYTQHTHTPFLCTLIGPQKKPSTTKSPKWCTTKTGLNFSVEFSFQNKIHPSTRQGWNCELSTNKF